MNDWNRMIDQWVEEELPQLLAAEGVRMQDGMIELKGLILAGKLMESQGFDGIGRNLRDILRRDGYNVVFDEDTCHLSME